MKSESLTIECDMDQGDRLSAGVTSTGELFMTVRERGRTACIKLSADMATDLAELLMRYTSQVLAGARAERLSAAQLELLELQAQESQASRTVKRQRAIIANIEAEL